MESDKEIADFYRPKNGGPDDWKVGLIPGRGSDDSIKNLGEESPVHAAIKQAGEDFLRARAIVRELEESGTVTRESIPDALADEVCEAMSCFARSPSNKFYDLRFAAHSVLQECFLKRAPEKFSVLPWTDAQYHAVVTYSFHSRFVSMFRGFAGDDREEIQMQVISAMEACLNARPDDAKMWVLFGGWLLVNEFFQDAQEKLKKALELDEEACFGAHYTIANILYNYIPKMERVNEMSLMHQFQVRSVLEGGKQHLEKYLELAPEGHWHTHRACVLLMLLTGTLAARGAEDTTSIERRNPGYAAKQHALFERCVDALRLYVKCFGREQSDFKSLFKQTASMVAWIHKSGLAGDNKMPECEYICGGPGCDNHQGIASLNKCARCLSVRYCSKRCQSLAWKSGHKKDCKRLKKEYEEQQKAIKMKRFDVEMSKIGDRPSDSEMDSFFAD